MASEAANGVKKPRSADELAPNRRPHRPDTGMIFLNKLLPIPPHLLTLATGLVAGSFLPSKYAALVAMLSIAPSILSIVTEVMKPKGQRESDKYIKKGRYAARFNGDFCVFLIGARYSGPTKLDKEYGWMGQAMGEIIADLQQNAEETGYLGHENCVSAEKDGSDTLLVVYFRSFDHLARYARSRTNAHAGPWAKLLGMGRRDPAFGFWHESYKVHAGEADAIYINCPPLGLGNCIDAELVKADGAYASARGRMGETKGEDYDTGLGQPDY